MLDNAATVEEYLVGLPADRREIVSRVRHTINAHLPDGYVEQMDWGMISWVVPLEDYPDTYNGKPLAYAALASQKNHVSVPLDVLGGAIERIPVGEFIARYEAARATPR